MKLEILLSALLTSAAVVEAAPFNILGRARNNKAAENSSDPIAQLLTKTFGASNSTSTKTSEATATGTLFSNNTGSAYNFTGYSNRTNTSSSETTLQYIITGGNVPIRNNVTANYTRVSNSTRSLNITELYDVASKVNATIYKKDSKGVVILANSKSVVGLGFLTDLIFNNDTKPIVISEDPILGGIVAQDKSSKGRGTVVVDKDGIIYQGSLAPSEKDCGIPIGIVVGKEVQYYYDNTLKPSLFSKESAIVKNFTNFTNFIDFDEVVTPVVPIIYDDDSSATIIESLYDEVQGLVVVTSNATESTIQSLDLPVVYASEDAPFAIVSNDDVPENTIGAGTLTAARAQLLLQVAIANGVTEVDALKEVFA